MTDTSILLSVGLNLKEEERQEENHNVVEKLKGNASNYATMQKNARMYLRVDNIVTLCEI